MAAPAPRMVWASKGQSAASLLALSLVPPGFAHSSDADEAQPASTPSRISSVTTLSMFWLRILARNTVQRPHRVRDVLAEAPDRAAVGGHERVVAPLRYRLPHRGASRLDLARLHPSPPPGCGQHRRVTRRRFEALHLDRHAEVRVHPEGLRDPRGSEQRPHVLRPR